jgi:hypothetical protein
MILSEITLGDIYSEILNSLNNKIPIPSGPYGIKKYNITNNLSIIKSDNNIAFYYSLRKYNLGIDINLRANNKWSIKIEYYTRRNVGRFENVRDTTYIENISPTVGKLIYEIFKQLHNYSLNENNFK